jgi:hypothetical protein
MKITVFAAAPLNVKVLTTPFFQGFLVIFAHANLYTIPLQYQNTVGYG